MAKSFTNTNRIFNYEILSNSEHTFLLWKKIMSSNIELPLTGSQQTWKKAALQRVGGGPYMLVSVFIHVCPLGCVLRGTLCIYCFEIIWGENNIYK